MPNTFGLLHYQDSFPCEQCDVLAFVVVGGKARCAGGWAERPLHTAEESEREFYRRLRGTPD